MELKQNNGSALTVSDDVFGVDYNENLIHQAVVAYQAGARQGTVLVLHEAQSGVVVVKLSQP